MNTSVSVIIPTYNRAHLVTAAVESVLGQTHRDVEIIVVDDGSTDDTEHRLRGFGDAIVYVKQANAGVNAARNRGLILARGAYIALLDNDDLWLERKLELQLSVLERYPTAGFVFSDFFVLRPSGTRSGRGISSWYSEGPNWATICGLGADFSLLVPKRAGAIERDFKVYAGDIYHQSLLGPVVLPTTALIRRSAISSELRFPESDPSCGDWEFFARLSKERGAVYMDVETAINRSHEDAVRLTRLPQSIQVGRRLAMVERVWKSDGEFCRNHGEDVVRVERELLLRLAMCHLNEGNRRAARDALCKRRRIHASARRIEGAREVLCSALTYLPGSGAALAAIRLSRRLAADAARWALQRIRGTAEG